MLLLSAIDPAANAQKQKVAVTVTPSTLPWTAFLSPRIRTTPYFYLQRTPTSNHYLRAQREEWGAAGRSCALLWIRYTEQRQRQELSFIQRILPMASNPGASAMALTNCICILQENTDVSPGSPRWTNLHHVYVTIDSKQILLTGSLSRSTREALSGRPMSNTSNSGGRSDNGKELMGRVKNLAKWIPTSVAPPRTPFNYKTILTVTGISVGYLLLAAWLIGYKSDQVFLCCCSMHCFYLSGPTRRFILAFRSSLYSGSSSTP